MKHCSSILCGAAVALSLTAFGCNKGDDPKPGAEPTAEAAEKTAEDEAVSAKADELSKLTDEQLAEELIRVTGGDQLGKQIADQMLAQFSRMPGMQPEVIEKFKESVKPDDLLARVAPVYKKHLTRDEMLGLIKFYKTPLGAAVVKKMPLITQESMTIGQQWGMELAQKVAKELNLPGANAPGLAAPVPPPPAAPKAP